MVAVACTVMLCGKAYLTAERSTNMQELLEAALRRCVLSPPILCDPGMLSRQWTAGLMLRPPAF
jgi:hypothetical protein